MRFTKQSKNWFFGLLICLLPLSVSAEEYVCSMSYEDASKNPYVLSVKREGGQFVLKSNNLLGGSGTASAKQIQEDETLIAMTELHLGGMVEVFLIDKEGLKIEHDQISTRGNIFWVPRRGTCMVRE